MKACTIGAVPSTCCTGGHQLATDLLSRRSSQIEVGRCCGRHAQRRTDLEANQRARDADTTRPIARRGEEQYSVSIDSLGDVSWLVAKVLWRGQNRAPRVADDLATADNLTCRCARTRVSAHCWAEMTLHFLEQVRKNRRLSRARSAWLGAISILAACHDVRVDNPFFRQVVLDAATAASGDAGRVGCPTDLIGFASVNGSTQPTNGGGAATPVTVSTLSDLVAHARSMSPAVIVIKGMVVIPAASQPFQVEVNSNKTIVGADASTRG